MDEVRLDEPIIKILWNTMSMQMYTLLMHASEVMVSKLHKENMYRRL